jgi:hypothetical protein
MSPNIENYTTMLFLNYESLSRMSRKVQVRFLGDKGGEIRLRYSTRQTSTDMILTKLKFSFLTGQCKFDGNLFVFFFPRKKKKPHPHCSTFANPH